MIVSLSGSNTFALRHRLKELTDRFVTEQGDLALERIDGEEAEVQAIIDAVQSLPFLSKRKMVVLRSPSLSKRLSEQIEQIISATSETTDLIIYEPLTDKRTVYYKAIKSKTQNEEFNELDSTSLVKWLVNEAKKRGGQLKPTDATYLVERLGANQELLNSELNKLLTYNLAVSRESIDLLTEPTPQSRIFDLLDASFGGNKIQALKLYDDQRAQKVEPQAILAMLAWQLQILSLVKLGQGQPPSKITQDTGLRPYPISKASGLVKKISHEQIKEMVKGAFDIDLKSKTRTIDLDEALKTYISTI
jgi:DNA polymerase III delta subunit